MQQAFYELADYLVGRLQGSEVLLLSFSGEHTDFVRFNHARIRQAGSVTQRYLTLDLVAHQRHLKATIGLSGDVDTDRQRAAAQMESLRQRLPAVPEDPYLLYATDVQSSERCGENHLPIAQAATEEILRAGQGKDLVGIYVAGGVYAGFANSLGQRNWFSSHSFNFDFSLYHQKDKAVKSGYAGSAWDPGQFAKKMAAAGEQLAILAQPARTIDPGQYRVYLAPAALEEFLGTLCWGGFSLKAHRTRSTPLLKMVAEGATFSPAVTLRENTREGIAPDFQAAGYRRPGEVVLIERGIYRDCLVSPRSAKEYGAAPNGASEVEGPQSLDLAPGDMPVDAVLARLGTGIFINQLHYLNYSDRPGCRITGMTRFATFWVQDGRIEAPLNVMRFDETAYRVLGENLLALTKERDFIPNPSTYGSRSTDSTRVPGVLVKDFHFTL
jgi:predicted Zn-dependent protease